MAADPHGNQHGLAGFPAHPAGLWTALAFGVVGMLNMPTMMLQGGLTRLLSLPHFAWAPLVVYLYEDFIAAAA